MSQLIAVEVNSSALLLPGVGMVVHTPSVISSTVKCLDILKIQELLKKI